MVCILFSSKIENEEIFASYNAALELMKFGFKQNGKNSWTFNEIKMIDTEFDRGFNVLTNFENFENFCSANRTNDFFIVLSPHKSKANFKSLTVHIPGNWNIADYGGNPRTLNIAYPTIQKALLMKMHEKNAKYKLDFSINYEVDHHGPTIEKPIIFVEIGSSVNEWKNQCAAKIIAETVFETINEKTNEKIKKQETFFGIGGGHYAPKFTKLAIEKDFAFGHILPKYSVDSIAQDTFQQAIEKSVEKIDGVAADKKGLNKNQYEKIKKLADEFAIKIVEV